ncbi:MAG: hypothetical protein IPM79_20605 [Polyangiaceae bacterium]|nr:hypothetical protein [Polyangiaceae bacterium]MBK8939955.1 hypothetical protein [Polyangiaceae bacterium]
MPLTTTLARAADIARTSSRLGRWLGPWAGAQVPRGVTRRDAEAGGSRAYVYEAAARPRGAYVVLPGLHFLGPDDPRLDRFCRILAAAGHLVVAPFIRSFNRLLLDPSAFDDARASLALGRSLAAARGLGPPAVFSISFGSRLALDLAASDEPPSAAILFGGYAEFLPTVRFAVTGRTEHAGRRHELSRDPLNSPVVYLNVLEHLELDGDRRALAGAWLEMVHRTWGKMELKAEGAREPIARAIAARLDEPLRAPFLRGCGLAPDAVEWLEGGLARAPAALSFLDPDRAVREVKCPIVLVHGKDDDVIPYFESLKLAERLPRGALRGLHVTGLYGHTGAARPTAAELSREANTMLAMLLDLARAPG